MKKIVLIPVLLLVFISCSKSVTDDSIVNSTTPNDLLGTWKLVGYYDDNGNEPNGGNYHL